VSRCNATALSRRHCVLARRDARARGRGHRDHHGLHERRERRATRRNSREREMTDHDYAPNLDHVLEDIEAGRNYTEWIVDRARPYLHGRVLDAGAGTGTFTEAVARVADEGVALEPEPRFVELLRQRFAAEPRVRAVHRDARELGAARDWFERIDCLNGREDARD